MIDHSPRILNKRSWSHFYCDHDRCVSREIRFGAKGFWETRKCYFGGTKMVYEKPNSVCDGLGLDLFELAKKF